MTNQDPVYTGSCDDDGMATGASVGHGDLDGGMDAGGIYTKSF